VRTHVLTCYNISWLLSALTCKTTLYRPSIQHSAEVRPKFGTRSVSLPKPSASAECHNLTFGQSLLPNCLASHEYMSDHTYNIDFREFAGHYGLAVLNRHFVNMTVSIT